MKALKIIGRIFTFCYLTVVTQVGGIVFLLSITLHPFIYKRIQNKWKQRLAKMLSFLLLYVFVVLLIMPYLAAPFGRVRLPLTETKHLKPLNFLTCLANRNYVRPELREAAYKVSIEMNKKFPGTTVNYLDGNFPFFDGFPLLPHLSHKDGKKLDVSFCYSDAAGNTSNEAPSFIGYGICEEPRPGEESMANTCAEKGYWNYSILKKIVPQGNKRNFRFDNERTRELVNLFAAQNEIGKIFIEPHLQTRLHLKSHKIRFHGCRAVRHDDHLHVQLK